MLPAFFYQRDISDQIVLSFSSVIAVGPGDPSRTMLVSQQMTQRMQMSQHMLQCLSESDLNGSASNSRLISEEMLFLSELDKDASHSGVGGLEEQKPPSSPSDADGFKSTGAETKSTDATISNELKMEPSEQNEDDESLAENDGTDDDADAVTIGAHINPETVLSNWQSLGFQSEEQAKHILALLSTEKTADERRDLIAKIASDE